ncbi:hypothetical protein QFC20_000040 [Naganishia adeliensis]|uniref:Uncharacterized protein n=1 Tax=Naganishia adeliensis TaxID=92952 RepID=A0ACC2X386_9TREE|nr:hypothetical protein QFC20_000040 [Naganishia adeliensis]
MDPKSDTKESYEDSETTSNMVPDLEKSLPYPHQHHVRVGASHYPTAIAPTLTIKHSPVPVHRLSRMASEASAARRIAARGDPSARAVAEFRTLSIHVTDTQRGAAGATSKKQISKAVKDLATLDFHSISIEEAEQRFSTSVKFGLDSEQATRRLKSNGPNKISKPPNKWWKKWLGYIFGGFGSLLILAAILCFIAWKPLGEPNPSVANLALAIVLVVVASLQTVFNAWQDYTTGKVMSSIKEMLPVEVEVLRNGAKTSVDPKTLVLGDLVYVKLGNKVAADLRLVSVSADLKFDKSILTGESDQLSGTVESTSENLLESHNIHCPSRFFMHWRFRVENGGSNRRLDSFSNMLSSGRIAKLSTGEAPGLTTLQKEILRFALIIASCALSIAVLVIILWGSWLNKKHKGFITVPVLIIDVVSVMVAFIPEGLPASVTISLSVVANALATKKVLCKSLMTVETLGSCTMVLSDKTGNIIIHVAEHSLINQNKMTVTSVTALDQDLKHVGVLAKEEARKIQQIATIAGLCNAATFERTSDEVVPGMRPIRGDATDTAILRFADSIKSVEEAAGEWQEVFRMDFNSKTKFMAKLFKQQGNTSAIPANIIPQEMGMDDFVLLAKGAPDILLPRCSFAVNPASNSIVPLDDSLINRLEAKQRQLASRGQRVILLTQKVVSRLDVPKSLQYDSAEFADSINAEMCDGLVVVGMLGLVDPPKEDVRETIGILSGAFIRCFMVTGDFASTAVAIAEQCGIITDVNKVSTIRDLSRDIELISVFKYDADDQNPAAESLVLTGTDVMAMNESQWEQACQYQEVVFARTTPEQKLRIVKEMQSRGNIVAATGDGANDAVALKQGDIGIAIAGGSDIAMEAADLILLESFSSMVVGVEYGRLVFINLRKLILYLLPAGSFSELMPILLNVFLGLPQILSSLQMIIICVVTDVLPAISLCFEKPESGLLLMKPRNTKKDRLVDWKLLFQAYFVFGLLESLCASSMAFWYLQRRGVPFSNIVLAYGGWTGGLDNDFVAEQVNRAQSVYFFTLIPAWTRKQGLQWG